MVKTDGPKSDKPIDLISQNEYGIIENVFYWLT